MSLDDATRPTAPELPAGAGVAAVGQHLVGLGDVLDRLDAEHHAIHGLLEGIDTALVALAHDPMDLAPITAAVDLLTGTLLSHFAYEEHELVVPLARFGCYPGQV